MPRRYRRRKRYSRRADPLYGLVVILVLGAFVYAQQYKEQIQLYGILGAAVLVVGFLVYFIWQKTRRLELSLDHITNEQLLNMLKTMTPAEFESQVADLFQALGFKTQVMGGANDGGIDVVAYRDGKKYFIQCKKYFNWKVTPHDVRDFLGAITNINNPATKGYLVTTNGFTLMAEKAAEGNPRIELIDGVRLVQYYRKAYGDKISERETVSSGV